jgi:two-component system OmpR family response regulator
MLHGEDGLSIVEALRDEGKRTPVLVISALSAVDERIRGLKAGGDDYLVKPFAMAELAARVEALLRRLDDVRTTTLRIGSLEMDLVERTVRRGGRSIELLPREFKLLEYFVRRPDQVVTRAMLLEDVWHYTFIPQTNVVDVHISNLRRKIDARGEAPLITNIRGVGFMLHADA